MDKAEATPSTGTDVEQIKAELSVPRPSAKHRIAAKFLLAAIGAIPWIGGFLTAAATINDEAKAERKHDLQTKWLEEHQGKIDRLGETLTEVESRFEALGPEIEERVQSDEYLGLVRKAFRAWDQADTEEKRRYAANIVVNSAGTRVCSDDVVRLFIDWVELYHEVHFAVIREIFQHPGATRFDIWVSIYGDSVPREDSAEADLFKLMIRDLSTGGVIRQERDTNVVGQFARRRPVRRSNPASTMESAFEDSKPYVLTQLGKQFVHYTMNEVVTRIATSSAPSRPVGPT